MISKTTTAKLFAFCLLFVFLFTMNSCRKSTGSYVRKENISIAELKDWAEWFYKVLPNAPKLRLDKADKAFINECFFVRVPIEGSTGMVYFAKSDHLEVEFTRIVPENGSIILYPFTGMYEFIDLNTFKYTRVSYVNGISIGKIKSPSNKKSNTLGIRTDATGWFSQLLYCISNYLLAVPAKVNGDWTGCWILGGGGDDEGFESPEGGGDGSSLQSIDWPSFLATVNPADSGPDPLPGGSGAGWTPITSPPYAGPSPSPISVVFDSLTNTGTELVNTEDPGGIIEFDFGTDAAIDVNKYFNCFDNIPDAGATYSMKLCADIPVNNNENDLISGLHPGHAFLIITKSNGSSSVSQTMGFYPTTSMNVFMLPVSSKLVDDGISGHEHEYNASILLPSISQSDFQTVKSTLINLASTKDYDLNDYNCTNFALEVFNSVSNPYIISVLDWYGVSSNINYGKTPNGLYKKLKSLNLDGTPNISIGTYTANTSHGPCN